MPNALDNVKVRYGQKTGEEKTISYPEFLALDISLLSEKEKELQAVMKKIYHLNECNSLLYKEFPNWRVDKPLTIDAMTLPSSDTCCASFLRDNNIIRFREDAFDNALFVILVHELKHAEDCTKEYYDLANTDYQKDGLSYHQIRILLESRARASELASIMMDCLNKKKSIEEFQSELKETDVYYYIKAIMPEIKKRYKKALETGQLLDIQRYSTDCNSSYCAKFYWVIDL